MNIDSQKIVYAAGAVITVVAALTTLSSLIVWQSDFDRETNMIYSQITEREIQMREEAICWWKSQGSGNDVQMCMQEYARQKAIRLHKVLNDSRR